MTLPNFEVDAKEFVDQLAAVSRAAIGSGPNRGRIFLKATDGLLSIRAAGGMVSAWGQISLETKREGSAVVEAAQIAGLFSGVAGKIVVGEKSGRLHFRSGTTKMSLAVTDPEEFPDYPSIEGTTVTLSWEQFERLMRTGGFAHASKAPKPIFQGIHFHREVDSLFVESTDSFHIAMVKADLGEAFDYSKPFVTSGNNSEFAALADGRGLHEAMRIVAGGTPPSMDLIFTETHMHLWRWSCGAAVPLIAGEYPKLIRYVPDNPPIRWSADRAAVLDALKRVRVTAADGDEMWVTSKANKVAFTSNGVTSDAQVIVEAKTDGGYEVCLSDRYLTAVLNALPDETFDFRNESPTSPILVKNDTQFYVIMPISRPGKTAPGAV